VISGITAHAVTVKTFFSTISGPVTVTVWQGTNTGSSGVQLGSISSSGFAPSITAIPVSVGGTSTSPVTITVTVVKTTTAAASYSLFSVDSIGYQTSSYTLGTTLYTKCGQPKDHYEFGFNGQMKTNEIAGVGNHNTALLWEYDTRTGRRWNIDPVRKHPVSGYSTFGGNPIWKVDLLGNTESTHTDKDGNVTDVINDGDKGIYKHNGNYEQTKKEVAAKHKPNNTSAGGTKMGETAYEDEFIYPQTGGVKNENEVGTKIEWGARWEPTLIEKMNEAKRMNPFQIMNESRNGGAFSLQDQGKHVGRGRLFQGKYYSTESMGNYLAGYNAASTHLISFDQFQRMAGSLHVNTHSNAPVPRIMVFDMPIFLDRSNSIMGEGFLSRLYRNIEQISQIAGSGAGIIENGTGPTHGEMYQQYRMSKMGWRKKIEGRGHGERRFRILYLPIICDIVIRLMRESQYGAIKL
jgi:hypothetical protein